MPTLFLHIGAAKTGTSALQSYLAANTAALLSRSILYPDHSSLDRARRQRITSGNGVPMAKLMGAPLPDGVTTGHIEDEMRAAFRDGLHLLYSSEAMSVFEPRAAALFVELARAVGYDIRIVIYVRSPVDRALSDYSQQVKSGLYSKTFAEYAETYFEPQGYIIEASSAVFGADRIVVRNYDAAADLPRDFLSVLGITDTTGFVVSPARINRSLTEAETAVMRVMAPLFASEAQARVVSDGMIYQNPDAEPMKRITSEAAKLMEKRAAGALATINRYLPRDSALTMSTDKIEVVDAPSVSLSPTEAALAAAIAGVVRAAGITIKE